MIRVRLQLRSKLRDLASANLAIDSKLRACELVKLRVSDVSQSVQMASRAMVMQQKMGRPVQFETTQLTRDVVQAWTHHADLMPSDFLFTSRVSDSPHLSTRQYARIFHRWSRMPDWSRVPTEPTRCAGPKPHFPTFGLRYIISATIVATHSLKEMNQ